MFYSSAESEVLSAAHYGKPTRLIVACWRLLAALWAILALFLTTIAVVAPPLLFALVALRGKNPFQAAILVLLAASVLGGVALFFGIPAVRAYALFVRPTRIVSLRFLAVSDLVSGVIFSILGAWAVFLMWQKPEEKIIYAAYVLFGVFVFSLNHAFRKKG